MMVVLFGLFGWAGKFSEPAWVQAVWLRPRQILTIGNFHSHKYKNTKTKIQKYIYKYEDKKAMGLRPLTIGNFHWTHIAGHTNTNTSKNTNVSMKTNTN